MEETTAIEKLCAEYGLKQTKLARRFGIPLRTVQDWHAGRRTPPDYVVGMLNELLRLGQVKTGASIKRAYPVRLIPEKNGYIVYIPDFDINTQGEDLPDALEMARDAIGIMGIDMEDDGEALPEPSALANVQAAVAKGELVSLVDVDFTEYRRRQKAVI